MEYSNEELVQLVQDGQEVHDPVEVDTLIDEVHISMALAKAMAVPLKRS